MADVLVVDDDPDICSLLHLALELDGHRVRTCTGGAEALVELGAIARAGVVLPVVVLDVQMPEVDGWAVLEAIRADPALADAPVILCTVRAAAADLERGWVLGCDAYQPKPFEIASISAQVGELASLEPASRAARRALLSRRS